MKVPRIYHPSSLEALQIVELDDHACRHIQVLRLQINHLVRLFNGDNKEYLAKIIHIDRRHVRVQIENFDIKDRESPLKIHLGQVISKGERMDFTLQKATELGVTSITPLFSTRSMVNLSNDREEKKMMHWKKVIISSCEQCGRNRLPILYPPIDMDEWVANKTDAVKIFLDPTGTQNFKNLNFANELFLLVGPEGGLTTEEIQNAKRHQFIGLSLGPRILRTETAAMVALSVLQFVSGDL